MPKDLSRDPGSSVKKALGAEVGFVCPVEDCDSPYLEWHHFDPQWRERHHHEVSGMIALCREHHIQADGGAFTREQLHRYKRTGKEKSKRLAGQFAWRREEFLAVAGGNYYYKQTVLIRLGNEPLIWFTRSADGEQLLNMRLPSISHRPRLQIEGNFWKVLGKPVEFSCPPGGKKIYAKYDNGDEIGVRFLSVNRDDVAKREFPGLLHEATYDLSSRGFGEIVVPPVASDDLSIPFTAVEVTLNVADTPIRLDKRSTTLPGNNMITGGFMTGGMVGIQIGDPSLPIGGGIKVDL